MRGINKKDLSVRQIKEIYGISRIMLQRYERIGLIKPTDRTKHGHLRYNKDMVNQILFIRFLQDCGFTLPEINKIVNLPILEIKGVMQKKSEDLKMVIKKLESLRQDVLKIKDAISISNMEAIYYVINRQYK